MKKIKAVKLKNVNLSILVLLSLIVISCSFYVSAQNTSSTNNNIILDTDQDDLTDLEEATLGTDPKKRDTDGDGYGDGTEVRSGYNPLVPAPGDKISTEKTQNNSSKVTPEKKDNVTIAVAQKISELSQKSNSEDQELTMEEIKSLVSQSLDSDFSDDQLPEIDKDSIKIKKQDYKKLSDQKAEEKRKEDFTNYITAVFYILSSNSPRPITSASDIMSISSEMVAEITSAMTTRDSATIKELQESSEKIFEQISDVEVPEDLLEIHIKALSFAMYGKSLGGDISSSKGDDPLRDIAVFSKVEGLISSLSEFSEEVQEKFEKYGLSYNDDLRDKLKDMGIELKEDE
jgi:hypothetical protein